jgi:4-hydroxybutyrate CoA-transferase
LEWRELYERRLMSAEDAVRVIKDGDLVNFSHAGPRILQAALYRRRGELRNVTVRSMAPLDGLDWYSDPVGAPFDMEVEILLGAARHSHDERVTTYLPNLFTTIFKPVDEGRATARIPDVYFTQVSAPDRHGYVHFGPLHWYKRSYVRRSRYIIAEVNPALPMVYGENRVHVSEIDAFVEVAPLTVTREELAAEIEGLEDAARRALLRDWLARTRDQNRFVNAKGKLHAVDLKAMARALCLDEPTPEQRRILAYVGELIPDGATLQVGVGNPSQCLGTSGVLDGKHDLGIHSEILPRGLATLVKRGVVTGKRKGFNDGKVIGVAWFGANDEDLDFIVDNPTFELHDPEWALNLKVMSENSRLHAVNNAISVDLLGQINSESIYGGHMVGGTGGQPEAVYSAVLSKGGRAIHTLESTAMGGSVTKIVGHHQEGSIVTVPRYFADTIVTEWGVAELMGKNERQRAEALIAIAHPDHRADLRQQANHLFYPDSVHVHAGVG